jgi:hypothetical protein
MRISITTAGGHSKHIKLNLTDFNRTRWALFGIRHNAQLQASLMQSPSREVLLLDSNSPQLYGRLTLPGSLPQGTHIALWDGLNSIIELFDKAPSLRERHDLVYLPVGHFAEIRSAFPANHVPLMPEQLSSLGELYPLRGSIKIDLLSNAQALLRPIKNRHTNRPSDALLRQGGQLVFCGMVRPSASVLENFFRGSSGHLRSHMTSLVDLDWRRPVAELARTIEPCWQALRDTEPQTLADWACHYSWANVMHRMATLCHIHAMTCQLFVNEYGHGRYIDPYDATAYRRNQFIDFGSTRGPDLIYPRSVDLHLRDKRCTPSRLMAPHTALADCLQRNTGPEFLALCERHAVQQKQALAALDV